MSAVAAVEARASEVRNPPPLRQLYFYLTEGCNLACRHCWLAPKFDPEGTGCASLPVELFETAIREAKPLGLTGVKLTGGEPLLHPEFAMLLEIARREELSLTVETNGMLCTPPMAAEIARSARRFVSVSLDGAEAPTHEWVRGVAGSFELAKQAIRNLVAADTPPQVIMTLMRENVDQVEPLVKLAEDLGASSVKFNVLQPTARGEKLHQADDALGVEELVQLSRHVYGDLARSTPLRLYFDVPLAFRPLSHVSSPGGCGVCGILGILGVIASGHYALCGIGQHVPELVFGEVGVDRVNRLWRDAFTLNLIRDGLPDVLEGVCARCLMRRRCLGSCIAQNYYRNGSLWAPFWFCDQAMASDLFPESRLIPVVATTL
jgi:SynChlorMet cassette radical SAM/SPASM protein ScmF